MGCDNGVACNCWARLQSRHSGFAQPVSTPASPGRRRGLWMMEVWHPSGNKLFGMMNVESLVSAVGHGFCSFPSPVRGNLVVQARVQLLGARGAEGPTRCTAVANAHAVKLLACLCVAWPEPGLLGRGKVEGRPQRAAMLGAATGGRSPAKPQLSPHIVRSFTAHERTSGGEHWNLALGWPRGSSARA